MLLQKEEERKQHEVYATENKACLYNKPFEPVKSSKPLTESSNFVLHTALRSEDRTKFDEEKKKRELEKQADEENRQAPRETEEEERIKALRKSLVHKALPIHSYPSINIKPSSKPPTKARSPTFLYKSRLRTIPDNQS